MNGGVGAAIVDGFEIAALTALRLGLELEQPVGPGRWDSRPIAV
jgi:hypothetical protein